MSQRTNRNSTSIRHRLDKSKKSYRNIHDTHILDDAYLNEVAYEAERRKNRKKRHRLIFLSILTSLLVLLGVAAANRQNLYDSWQLHNYHPNSEISSLATQDSLTAYARKVFYVNHPTTVNGENFKTPCPNDGGEQTIVLGCYHGNQAGIYVLKVDDPLLNGVEQVTAAHEMLHAAYDRLSYSERKKVDAMLLDYYNHELKDPRILTTISAYKKSEPKDVINEMHSVFGTEALNLPTNLENYYKKYFVNRHYVAQMASNYQSEFTSRQDLIQKYDAQLDELKQQIDSQKTDLKVRVVTINAQHARLLALKDADIPSYNSSVPGYNNLVDAYNREAQNVRSNITEYNALVIKRNAIALEEDQLVKELSSSSQNINK